MNTKKKGSTLEARFNGQLGECGYICEKARPIYSYRMSGRPFATAVDLFKSFDTVAKKANQKTLWVQVTSKNVSIASKARRFVECAEPWFNLDHDEVIIVRWHEPEKPGESGQWQIVRWCDGFDPRKAHFLSTGARSLPWEIAP